MKYFDSISGITEKCKINYVLSFVRTTSQRVETIEKNVEISIEIQDLQYAYPIFTAIRFKIKSENVNSDKLLESFKKELKKYGWKSIDEYIEKKVYPFFYAQCKIEEINKINDTFLGSVYKPLKQLEYEIKYNKLQREKKHNENSFEEIEKELNEKHYITYTYCSDIETKLSIEAENALIRLFEALKNPSKVKGADFFTQLKRMQKMGNNGLKVCREYIIYMLLFPKRYSVFLEMGGGYKELPSKLTTREISEALKASGFYEENKTIRRICKEMHIELSNKIG